MLLLLLPALLFADLVEPVKGDRLYGEILWENDTAVTFDGDAGEIVLPADSIKSYVVDEKKLARKIRAGLVHGDVRLFRKGKERTLEFGKRLKTGDSLVTGPGSRMECFLYKNDIIRLEENSALVIGTFLLNKRDRVFVRHFTLHSGRLYCYVRKDYREIKPVEIATPGAVITAASSVIALSYSDADRTTVVDIAYKKGEVGFRPTRMNIGKVVLKDDERAVLNEDLGNITEDEIGEAEKQDLKAFRKKMSGKRIRAIEYPKRPLKRKWLYLGAGTLVLGGGVGAALYYKRSQTPEEEELTSIKVQW